ncbi:MAG: glycoside hydrolase family 26 protein [Actinomycetota bacterium]
MTIAVITSGALLSVALQHVAHARAKLSHQAQPHLSGTVPPPAEGAFYWGDFREGAPYDTAPIEKLHQQTGRWPAIVMWFQEWYGEPVFDTLSATWLNARGIVPMVTWEPWKPELFGGNGANQPEYSLKRIASGAFDSYIKRYAEACRSYGGPLMIRLFHEMDGFWYPWGGTVNGNTPQLFVASWRRIHDIFRAAGATNVTWIWSVNTLSVPFTPQNQIENYWPGSSYVDWVGATGFNRGNTKPQTVWESFDQVYSDRYHRLLQFGKPVILSEMGAPETGGDKAAWITNAFEAIESRYPKVGAIIWFDRPTSPIEDWRIDSSKQSLAAFTASLASSAVLGAPAALDNARRQSPSTH